MNGSTNEFAHPINDWSEAERRVEQAHRCLEQQRWQEAARELRVAVAINPYNAEWFFSLGTALDEMKRYAEAAGAYRKCLSIHEANPAALERLAAALHRTGQFALSIETLERLQTLDSSDEVSYCGRVASYVELGRHEQAEEMFYLARLFKARCPRCDYNMGVSLERRGQWVQALALWRRALEEDPTLVQARLRSAEVHRRLGQWEQARICCLEGLRVDPGHVPILLELAEILIHQGRPIDAMEKIQLAIGLAPEDPAAHFILGRLFKSQHRHAQALEAFVRVLKLDPTFPCAHLELARLYQMYDQLDLCRMHLRAEMHLRPHEPDELMSLANLLMDVGQVRQAAACLKRLVAQCPDHADGWANLAVSHFLRQQSADGIECCRQALRLAPGHQAARHNLALALINAGRYDEARDQVLAGLAAAPGDPGLSRLRFRIRLLWLRHRFTAGLERCLGWTRIG